MNKTRYKIATLTGSAVMAAMLLSLLILNIVFNKKIELRAEQLKTFLLWIQTNI